MNMKPNSLAVVTTVTSDTQRKDHSARREAEYFWTIELNNAERLCDTVRIRGLG
jgi:hypothetical protein